MKIGEGRIQYSLGETPCSGVGMQWSENELSAEWNERVAAVLFDDEGKAILEDILAGLAEADFAYDGLQSVLEDPDTIEDWRVGEAIAEAYLADHRSCSFPWPDGRDERKGGSSLPGADLVGFGIDEVGDCLAFGEVKTSRERRYPPGVMRGRAGLKRQLEDLRNDESIRAGLVRYLGHRATSSTWQDQYKRAVSRYLQNSSDIQLFGCLVRDVEPSQDDLRLRVDELSAERPEGMRIELLALYLPQEGLDGIGERMVSRRRREAR